MSLFAELAGVMSRADIAKSAEKRRWKDVSLNRKSIARLSNTSAVVTCECNANQGRSTVSGAG
jgi:hypothetical protein